MTRLSEIALYLSFGVGCYAVLTLALGVFARRERLTASGKNAVLAMSALVMLASLGLWRALLTDDFSVEYVAEHSNRTLAPMYKVTSFWSGMEGSLLFWLLLLSIYAFVFMLRNRKNPDPIYPTTALVVGLVQVFFAGIAAFAANPFTRLDPAILARLQDGNGLNNLLQDPAMAIHPPCLFVGYVGWAIPFGFGIAVLLLGRRGSYWIEQARPWILVPWIFLTLGFCLGGWWAYRELGWGGYWAWDPVENASIIPWFTGTAFLHSVMIQQRRDMLKVWNMVLLLLTFLLTIFGTFLTRGGLKQLVSVHSFTGAGFASSFAIFIGAVILGSAGLMLWRYPVLKSPHRFDSVLSREVAFLLNNLVLLCICIATLAGTVWPVISQAVVGRQITVGEEWFNAVNVPLGLALLLLTGIGPVISWRKASASSLRRTFSVPIAMGLLTVAVALVAGIPIQNWKTHLLIFAAVFSLSITVNEFRRGAMARSEQMGIGFLRGLAQTAFGNRRRYGGYLVHAGIVMAFIGFLGSHKEGYQKIEKSLMAKGDELSSSHPIMGNFSVQFEGTEKDYQRDSRGEKHALVTRARLLLKKNGEPVTYLLPAKCQYLAGKNEETTEVAYHATLFGDVYAVVGGFTDDESAAGITLYLNPLIGLVWWGAAIVVLGGLFCVTDRRRVIQARVAPRSQPEGQRTLAEARA